MCVCLYTYLSIYLYTYIQIHVEWAHLISLESGLRCRMSWVCISLYM